LQRGMKGDFLALGLEACGLWLFCLFRLFRHCEERSDEAISEMCLKRRLPRHCRFAEVTG
jgi:hypothetical protein